MGNESVIIIVDGLIVRLSKLPECLQKRLCKGSGVYRLPLSLNIIPTLGYDQIERIVKRLS